MGHPSSRVESSRQIVAFVLILTAVEETSASCVIFREGTFNLMSETLMSVANKLEQVFNIPNERKPVSRPTIKRVYVIKFDENSSKGGRRLKRCSQTNLNGGESTQTRRAPKSTQLIMNDPTLDAEEPIEDKANTDEYSDDYERSSNDCKKSTIQNDKTKKIKLFEEDAITDLINRVTSTQNKSVQPSRRKTGFNYKFLLRDTRRDRKKSRIPEIFDAILNEVGSMTTKAGRMAENHGKKPTTRKKIKTLSEVLESEDSLMNAEYTIPRSMIKKEAVARLQTLIDRAAKKSEKFVSRADDDDIGNSEIVGWQVNERPMTTNSYYTAVINDRDANNIGASSSVASGPICRICHGRHGTLVKPCRCRGTMAYVHVECLQVWLTEKEVNYCELCNFTFRVIHVPEYKILPSISFWYKFAATSQQRKTIMVDLTLAIVSLPFLICLTMIARSITNDSNTDFEDDEDFDDNVVWHFGQLSIKVSMFLFILSYIAGVIVRINHHLSDWFSWYVNKNVTLVLENQEQNHGDEAE